MKEEQPSVKGREEKKLIKLLFSKSPRLPGP